MKNKIFNTKDNFAVSIVKSVLFILFVLILVFGAVFNYTPAVVIAGVFLIIILDKNISSKNDINRIWKSGTNAYILVWHALFYAGVLILLLGLVFAYTDKELIKYLLVLSFTLAGIEFVGIIDGQKEKDEVSEKVWRYSTLSCFLLSSSGFAFLLSLGSSIMQPTSPFTNQPIKYFDFLHGLAPTMSVIGSLMLTLGVYMMMLAVLCRLKQGFHSVKRRALGETIKNGFNDFFAKSL